MDSHDDLSAPEQFRGLIYDNDTNVGDLSFASLTSRTFEGFGSRSRVITGLEVRN